MFYFFLKEMFETYDIIVVGGGHAGCEAAAAGARLGSKVLLITLNLSTIAQMSCNPAMGGIAKGQIIREIDALGGYSGIVTDKTMIQFRMLNRSKGPAMWSPRAQSDRMLFSAEWRRILESIPNLHFWQDNVQSLLVKDKTVVGVKTSLGIEIFGKAVILTSGTFLNGIIHIGEKKFAGGRLGESNSFGISEQLKELGVEVDRMKTGTPVRVDGRTINFDRMIEQPGDSNPGKFSYLNTPKLENQRSCYLTYTSQTVHDVLKTGFEKSPLFQGRIQGRGPRYCPSIEDKIERFSDKDRHQLFVEPEGWDSNEYYINGFSSSLPEDIQYKALKLIPGFEDARILKPGYAIEYDFFPPQQLEYSLESRIIKGLYFAGQINGTTGYEEAGCQGLMAGINAHLKIQEKDAFILKRSEAYIGVLIDDLISKGTNEPYRMFTSRAEYRLLLRQDNADSRLTPKAFELGLADDVRMEVLRKKEQGIGNVRKFVNETSYQPEEINPLFEKLNTSVIARKTNMLQLLLRPQVSFLDLYYESEKVRNFVDEIGGFESNIDSIEAAEILIKYEGYFEKEREMAEKISKFEDIELKEDFNYNALTAISFEGREKLNKIRPRTIGQASRISGISPADISVLLVFLGR